MEPAILVLAAALPISWLLAEFRGGGRFARVGLGIACIVCAAVTSSIVAGVIPSYERSIHRACMGRLAELLARGETARVQQALETYNSTANTKRSTYQAAMTVWDTISEKPDERKSR